MRVAVVFSGDARDPSAWSGTPAGIVSGLEAAGAEVVVIRARPRARFDQLLLRFLALPGAALGTLRTRDWHASVARAKSNAGNGLVHSALCGVIARRRLSAAGPVDGVVQIGTSYVVRHPRLVTYEDMTIPQAFGSPWFGWQWLPAWVVAGRRRTQRAAYREAWRACTATPWTASSIISDYGIPAAQVVPVGIGANHDSTVVSRDWSQPKFLFIGKDWTDKNGPTLLKAFALLRQVHPTATLDIVGNHPAIDEPGVTGHGYLALAEPGPRATMARLLSEATCLVVPTSFEPAGIAYVEAAAAGLPSIGTNRGGAADVIGPGGLTVDPTSASELARAMSAMCDAGTAMSYGAAGAARAGLLTWPAVGRRLLQTMGLTPHVSRDWKHLFDA